MIQLVSKVVLPDADFSVKYSNNILSLGSCFSENMGLKLQNAAFSVDINPFGVLFNPVSILHSIERIRSKRCFGADEIFCEGDIWGSLSHSTLFSDTDMDSCLAKINEKFMHAADRFDRTDLLIITFGTAWAYKHTELNKTVANCHKIPAKKFERYRLTTSEISKAYIELLNELKAANTNLNVILTVSPVRHIKDGPTENHISKAVLLDACLEIKKNCKFVCYFPSYEIMMDELRDYRFYATDMMHPSELAIGLIFEKFMQTFFDSSTMETYQKALELSNAKNHRPLHENSKEYKRFCEYTERLKQELMLHSDLAKNNPDFFE